MRTHAPFRVRTLGPYRFPACLDAMSAPAAAFSTPYLPAALFRRTRLAECAPSLARPAHSQHRTCPRQPQTTFGWHITCLFLRLLVAVLVSREQQKVDATSLGILWVSIGVALTFLLQAQSRRIGSIDKELATSREALYASVTELQLGNTKLREEQRSRARALKQCSSAMAAAVEDIVSATTTLKEKSDAGAATTEHYSAAIAESAEHLTELIESLTTLAANASDMAPAEASPASNAAPEPAVS